MYRDVILVNLKGGVELLPVLHDIDPNVEMGRSDLVLLKECIQLIGRLKWKRVMRSELARYSALRNQEPNDRRLQSPK